MSRSELNKAINYIRQHKIDPTLGLPEDLFLMISGLVPIANVDLLLTNEENQILLARRNDIYYENSWYLPGGCIRYGETFVERAHKVATLEFGKDVSIEPEPLVVRTVLRDMILENEYPRERGHHVAILMRAHSGSDFIIDNKSLSPIDDGYLKWFSEIPENFMKIQYVFSDVLKQWDKKNILGDV